MMDARITLPGTALSVSRLCLGGNRFGGDLDRDASFALLDAFVALGGNFIDTAHVYADWIPGNETSSSEKTLGRWLASRRPDAMVIATKGGHPPLGEPSRSRLDAVSLRHDVEEGLRNLGLDRLDLFYLHRDDPTRPAADILSGLEELCRAGLILHYGASNWSTARLEEAQAAAARHGWQGFAANQAEWSLARRNPQTIPADLRVMDAGMIALHHSSGLPAIPYSAQAKGYFDKIREGTLDTATARLYDNRENRLLATDLAALATLRDASPTQLMLAAMINAPFPTVPVVGCRTSDQIRASFASLSIDLPQDQVVSLLSRAGCLL